MPAAATVFTVLAGIVAVVAVAVYFLGIPPEMKRAMEKKALETMGENKASYLMKDQISKMPESDQKDVENVKKGLGNVLGSGLQNPIGDNAGELGDDLTKNFTGR